MAEASYGNSNFATQNHAFKYVKNKQKTLTLIMVCDCD